ncbi:MAG: hypothetical protein K2X81_13445 [Candidatus Obscuribacterales bacterium]|nr:hypothetical protein [Candidatus Obscuribacterales bacterium]
MSKHGNDNAGSPSGNDRPSDVSHRDSDCHSALHDAAYSAPPTRRDSSSEQTVKHNTENVNKTSSEQAPKPRTEQTNKSDCDHSPKSSDHSPKSSEQAPKSSEQAPKSSEQAPKSSEQPPKSSEQPPCNPDLPPSNPDLPPSNPDLPPSNPDLPPSNPDVPPSGPNPPEHAPAQHDRDHKHGYIEFPPLFPPIFNTYESDPGPKDAPGQGLIRYSMKAVPGQID